MGNCCTQLVQVISVDKCVFNLFSGLMSKRKAKTVAILVFHILSWSWSCNHSSLLVLVLENIQHQDKAYKVIEVIVLLFGTWSCSLGLSLALWVLVFYSCDDDFTTIVARLWLKEQNLYKLKCSKFDRFMRIYYYLQYLQVDCPTQSLRPRIWICPPRRHGSAGQSIMWSFVSIFK